MPYLKIHSRDWCQRWHNSEFFPLKLRVIQEGGVEVNPTESIKVTNLKKGKDNTLYKQFLNLGDGGITFKIKVKIHKDDIWNMTFFEDRPGQEKVTYVLKRFYTEMTVLNVVTDFIDVPDGNYIITKNPSRVQSFSDYTEWELEFTTYKAINTFKYKNNNTAVKNAIANANKANQKKTTTTAKKNTTKKASTKNAKLAKCTLNQLKYSKKSKVVTCVKYMQEVLYKQGYLTKKQIDGWYGPKTLAAVKKFQKKYKKKYGLKETGNIDKKTLEAMCQV